MDDVTVGIDIGSTSVKAVAATADGTIVARSRVVHGLQSPRPGRLQHDARVAWVDGPRQALAELGVQPRAISVDAMVPSMCAVDADGVPSTPGLLYGDERGIDPSLAPGEAPVGRSGEPRGFLEWTVGQAPGAHGYWPAQAVANHALGGEAVLDFGTALSHTPLFSFDGWDADVLASLGVTPSQMPRVAGMAERACELSSGAVLAAGGLDVMSEQLVSGAVRTGDCLVMCGTTLLIWALVPDERQVDGLWCTPFLPAPGAWVIGGASNAGGLFQDWVRRLLPDASPATDPDDVPVWAPYLRGERTPLHDRHRRGALVDVALTHGPSQLVQAGFEAAGFVVRHHLDLAGVVPERLVATGGGTLSAGWVQALADCTGVAVDVSAVPDGAALGSAFMARMALEGSSDFTAGSAWARTGHTIVPRPAWRDACDARYRRFRELSA